MAKSRAKTALLFGAPAILLALVLLDIGAGIRRERARAEPDRVRAATRHGERFPELIERIQEHVDRKAIAGAVVLVLHRGKPVCFEALGMADAEARTPMSRDTIFRIASMTKPITSVAALMLVEDGKLRLDDPVSKYLPEFKDMTVLVPTKGDSDKPYQLVEADRAVTIQHLLTHTSGITHRLSNRPHLGLLYADAGISDGLVETVGTVGDNVSRLAKLPLLHQPGTAWEYGLSLDVLGRVVEIVSGQTLAEFFRTRIFEPLRMRDTGFVVPKNKRSRLAALYTTDSKKTIHRVGDSPVSLGPFTFSATYSTEDDSRYQSGGAGLASTAGDYGRFLQMLLNRGELDGQRLLKAETVDRMTRNQIGALKCTFPIHGDGFGYGWGVVTGREVPASPASKGSYSWGGIFNTFFWVDPNEELIGLLFTQFYPFDHLTLRKDFQELVYQDHKETKVSLAGYETVRQSPKAESREDGFLTLFDGKTLDGWEGKQEYFSVKDGAIHAETTKDKPLKANTFLVYTRRLFADFELRFDYKVVGGNSGMQYRSERLPDFVMKGYQADFENQNRFTGMFFEENGRMFLAYPGEFVTVKPLTDAERTKTPKAKAVLDKVPFATREEVFSHIKDATAWHSMTIIAKGNTFVHVLDGRVMSVAVDDDPKNFRKSGSLGLQVHSGPPLTIDLKNVRIREFK